MWVVSLPLQLGITGASAGWTIAHCIGILLWSIGLFLQAVGDWQLSRYLANPANKGRVSPVENGGGVPASGLSPRAPDAPGILWIALRRIGMDGPSGTSGLMLPV